MQTFAYGSGYYGDKYLGKRSNQEDEHGFMPSLDQRELLAVLADGMGGHAAGEVASRLAVAQFLDSFRSAPADAAVPDRLALALAAANAAIEQAVQRDPALAGMGCTLVGVHVGGAGLHWISVGDSPLYLVRGGVASQINQDHSMATMIRQSLEAGRITAEEAAAHPGRHVLLSALMGDGPPPRTDLPARPMPLRAGDVILIASDGLQTLTEREIGEMVRPADPAKDAVLRLIAAVHAHDRPRQDNTTVQVVRIERDLPGGAAAPGAEAAAGPRAGAAAPRQTRPLAVIAWVLVAAVAALTVAAMALLHGVGWTRIEGWVGLGPPHHAGPGAAQPSAPAHAAGPDGRAAPAARRAAGAMLAPGGAPGPGATFAPGGAVASDEPGLAGANPGVATSPGPHVLTPLLGDAHVRGPAPAGAGQPPAGAGPAPRVACAAAAPCRAERRP